MELEAALETIRRLEAENRALQERANPHIAIERLGMGSAATLCWVCVNTSTFSCFQCAAQYIVSGGMTSGRNHGEEEFYSHYVTTLHPQATQDHRASMLRFLRQYKYNGGICILISSNLPTGSVYTKGKMQVKAELAVVMGNPGVNAEAIASHFSATVLNYSTMPCYRALVPNVEFAELLVLIPVIFFY